MPYPSRFPAVEGGCFCGQTRFKLQVPPLFCSACHCSDCQKDSGSVYACFVSIEAEYITSEGAIPPKITKQPHKSGQDRLAASCAACGIKLWATGDRSPVTSDVRVGVLDHPQLFEPDLHSFIENKIPWVVLPEGTRTCKGQFDLKKEWPKSSLRRYNAAVKRYEERVANLKRLAAAAAAQKAAAERNARERDAVPVEDGSGLVEEADKTPTAQSPDLKENGKGSRDGGGEDDDEEFLEDDEEFERRYRETEKALQARLEILTAKLAEQKIDQDK